MPETTTNEPLGMPTEHTNDYKKRLSVLLEYLRLARQLAIFTYNHGWVTELVPLSQINRLVWLDFEMDLPTNDPDKGDKLQP